MSRCHFLLLLLCASVIGCGNSSAAQRTVTKQLMSATKEMADLLATVKDKPSAQAVAPKLLTLIDRVDKLNERLEEMETEDSYYHDTELLQEVGSWIAEHTRLMEEEHRISQIPQAREGLGEAWQQLTGGAYDPGGIFAPGGKMDLKRGPAP